MLSSWGSEFCCCSCSGCCSFPVLGGHSVVSLDATVFSLGSSLPLSFLLSLVVLLLLFIVFFFLFCTITPAVVPIIITKAQFTKTATIRRQYRRVRRGFSPEGSPSPTSPARPPLLPKMGPMQRILSKVDEHTLIPFFLLESSS